MKQWSLTVPTTANIHNISGETVIKSPGRRNTVIINQNIEVVGTAGEAHSNDDAILILSFNDFTFGLN